MPENPKPRDPNKDFAKFWSDYMAKYLPESLAAEDAARIEYDPRRIEQDIELEDLYGGSRREQTLGALDQLDPYAAPIRGQMAATIFSNMQNPYGIPDDLRIEAENDIRGAQTARGNFLGNGAVTAESIYKGRLRQELGDKRIAQAGAFLGTPSPVTLARHVQPVTPDRMSGYVGNPMQVGQQGVSMGQQAFNNQQQQYQNAQQEPNWWQIALQTGGQLAAAYYGGAGFSDERMKNTIEDTGERTRDGIPIVTFFYNGIAQKFKGVIAQTVQKIRPDAVIEHEGRLMVLYDLLGMQMTEVD